MRNTTILGFILVIVLALLAACGGDGDDGEINTTSSQAGGASSQAASVGASGGTGGGGITLAQYAAEHAGGPGAIYVGDINQLVGPAATDDQGDADGNVPLDALERHRFVFESDYYKGLLEKANLTNPTPLTSTETVTIQHACLNRALSFCRVAESFMFPNVQERTGGKLDLVMSSFPELGLAGPDIPNLLASGTLDMGSIVGPYVAGEVPALEIQYLFGAFTSREEQFVTTAAIAPEVEQLLADSSNGGKLILKEWASGNDIFFFSKKPLLTLDDFKGLKTRAFGTSISDWINGMGAEAQFVAFAEVYTALERGILGAGVTGGDAGFGQRWYEVTGYINGPLISWPANDMVISKDVWEKMPADMQQILLEEGAKAELEMLRLGAIQNEVGLKKNVEQGGMEYVEFSPELRAQSDAAVIGGVIPNWAQRVGLDSPWIDIFNEKVGPVVGYRIEPDGSVTQHPKVMPQ